MKFCRYAIFFYTLLFIPSNGLTQNLAPNPNFSNHSLCPGNGQLFTVDNWTQISSPDYFHVCSAIWLMGVPTNFPGYQPSYSEAYIGMKSGEPIGAAFPHREFAQAQLTQPLIAGCYELSITYSNADYAGYCNGLGMHLSNGIPGPPFIATYVGLTPHVEVIDIIPDSIDWHIRKGTYNAVGGETHITLGNFRENIDLTFIPTSGTIGAIGAYSLIDSVSVIYLGPACANSCTADAGIISIANNPSCPSGIINFNINAYNASSSYTQYILITDATGTIVDMTQGDSYTFSHDYCADFTVHSYNLEIAGTAIIPSIGDNISLIDCTVPCCDLISEPFSFEDNIAPNFTFVQENPNNPSAGPIVDIFCVDDIPALQPAQYDDNCIGMGSVIGMDIDMSSPCLGGTYIRTWDISDSCNTTIEQQTIIIEPSPIPEAINPPADLTVSCENVPTTAQPLVFSNGLSNSCALITTVQPIRQDNYDACGGTAQFIWQDTDDCGRLIEYTQNLIVLPAPMAIFLNTVSQQSISCENVGTISPVLEYSNGLSGNCLIQGTVLAMITGSYDGCGGQLDYHWSFIDNCGREISHTLEITVESTTPPTLDSPPLDITLDCGVTNYNPPVLNYSNNNSNLCLLEGSIAPTTSTNGNQILVTWEDQIPCIGLVTETQTVTLQPSPNISIDLQTASICLGNSFDLANLVITDANNTGATISYHSAIPPGASNELSSTLVSPSVTTDYYVAAILNGICVHFVSFTLVVNPPINLVDSGNGQVCRDTNFYSLFNFLDFVIDSSGIWKDLDGAGLNLTDPVNVQFNNVPVGDYNFSYLIPPSGTCPGDSAIATISVLPQPEIIITSQSCSSDLNFYSIIFSSVANAIVNNNEGTLENPTPTTYEITNIPITDTLFLNVQDPLSLCQKEISIIPPDCSCALVTPPISNGDVVSCIENLPASLSVTFGIDQNASWYSQATGGTLLSANTSSYQPPLISPGFYTFYVETFDLLNPDCKSTTRTPISLTILDSPRVTDAQLTACQDAYENSTTFFLEDANNLISINPIYNFSYHLTFDHAVNNSIVLENPYTIMGQMDRIIYVRVTDSNGCFSIAEILLTILPPPTVSLITTDINCAGDANGIIEITSLNAQGNISTSLDSLSFSSNLIYNNLDSGSYTLFIQDSLLCSNEYTFDILSNNAIYIDLFDLVCDDNGTINDPSDDFYLFQFNLRTDGSGSNYNVFSDMTNVGLFNYGENQSLTIPADGNIHVFRFYDPISDCEKIETSPELIPCSDPCIVYPNSTILVDPSNILDCSTTSINLSSMNESEVSYSWTFNDNPINNLSKE